MLMHNLLEYSHNYSMTSGNLSNYYRDKIDYVDINDNASNGKTLEHITKIVVETPEKPSQPGNAGDEVQPEQPSVRFLNVEVTIPLKYLIIFWKHLHLPLINCEVELDLTAF